MPATAIGILSNKGGVGKTHLATNLAIALAQRGKKVLLVDADWSSANVTRKLGLTPPRTLRQFFNDECGVADLITGTPHHPNLYILAGSPGEFAIANMDHARKVRLLSAFHEIARHSRGDYILFDLGAGIEARTLDTALATDHQIVITTPQDVLAGYGCLKALLYRFLDLVPQRPDWLKPQAFRPYLIVNQVLDPGQGKVVANTMRNLLREYAQERAHRDPDITQYFQPHPVTAQSARIMGHDGATMQPHGPVLTTGRMSAATSTFAVPPVHGAPSLEVDLRLLGEVPYARERFILAEMNRTPFLLAYPKDPTSIAIHLLADNLTGESTVPQPVGQGTGFWQRLAELVST